MADHPEPYSPRSIRTTRTARYFYAGPALPANQPLWMACHGYGQLASNFISHFDDVASRGHFVVAPEALSRFYLRMGSRQVGASWMTSHAREDEIRDYVAYLDNVLRDVEERLGTGIEQLIGFGFSQGVATIARWAAVSARRFKALVLWAGVLPQDVPWASFGPAGTGIVLVRGDADEVYKEKAFEADLAMLSTAGLTFRSAVFKGGHQMHDETLMQIARELENDDQRPRQQS